MLRRLAQRVWWHELEGLTGRLAATYRAERERHTARILYALLRNLALWSKHPSFEDDRNLADFRVQEPVPEISDPLAPLNSPASIAGLVQEVVETILYLQRPGGAYVALRLEREGNLAYIHSLALAIAKDPYAGRTSVVSQQGVSSRQIRLALEELHNDTDSH